MTSLNNNKLKVGIAGFGVVGKKRYHFLQENPHFETVAVSDIRFKDKGSFNDSYKLMSENDVSIYYDYIDLFEKDIDVLFVSLPNYLAPDATIRGLRKGCHVFCEKPPGRNVKDIKDVIQIEKSKSGLKLKYGFNHRYHGSVEKAKNIIDSKEFGRLTNKTSISFSNKSI